MADPSPHLYGPEVELIVASVVQHCIAREDDRPLIQQQLYEIFQNGLTIDDACFNELIDEEKLRVIVNATKIALKRMHKGFKKSLRTLNTPKKHCVREVCGQRISSKTEVEFRGHINPECKTIACNECDKCFTTLRHFQRHQLIHTGERPYSCPKKVYRKDDLRAHQIRLHGKGPTEPHSGPKPFKCDDCGAAFYLKDDLDRHKLTHTGMRPYKCDTCAKRFTRKDTLVIHQKLHFGKLLECDVCGKGFRVAKYLARHMQLHTGLKPHKCGVCNMAFARKYYLYSHLKTHGTKTTNALDEGA